MSLTSDEQRAVELARLAQDNAHAPYSGKQVGAAVVSGDGRVFAACNVENADSTLRICAERAAVIHAVAAGARDFTLVVVIAPDTRFWPPCDACRAVLYEFAPDPQVILVTRHGRLHKSRLSELSAMPFSSDGDFAPK